MSNDHPNLKKYTGMALFGVGHDHWCAVIKVADATYLTPSGLRLKGIPSEYKEMSWEDMIKDMESRGDVYVGSLDE